MTNYDDRDERIAELKREVERRDELLRKADKNAKALWAELKTLKGRTFYELHRDLALRMVEGTASPEDLAKLARVREVLEIQSNHQTVERWRELEAEVSALKAENERLQTELGELDAELIVSNAEGRRLAREAVADEDAKALRAEVSALKAQLQHTETVAAMETERVAVAVEAEREACAAIVDPAASGFGAVPYRQERERLAALIRGRSRP